MISRRSISRPLAGLLSAAYVISATAQGFPAKTVSLVVPYLLVGHPFGLSLSKSLMLRDIRFDRLSANGGFRASVHLELIAILFIAN